MQLNLKNLIEISDEDNSDIDRNPTTINEESQRNMIKSSRNSINILGNIGFEDKTPNMSIGDLRD